MSDVIKIGDYIQGYECVGPDEKLVLSKGWVSKIIYEADLTTVRCYCVNMDDGFHGARSNYIWPTLGEVVKINNKVYN